VDEQKQITELIARIEEGLARAYARKAKLEEEIAHLQREGIFNPIPTTSWETREGKGRYLRLVFPTGPDGGRRRVYVGADPQKVQGALDKIARSRRHEQLQCDLAALSSRLSQVLGSLRTISYELANLVT